MVKQSYMPESRTGIEELLQNNYRKNGRTIQDYVLKTDGEYSPGNKMTEGQRYIDALERMEQRTAEEKQFSPGYIVIMQLIPEKICDTYKRKGEKPWYAKE